MGLEAATYIQDLDASNPLAGDKKNVGDDHLRLIKAVNKTTFPNADRPFRFPEVPAAKTVNYAVLTTDENKVILCDTTAAAFTVTLPTPTIDGWMVKVMKISADANYVMVAPPTGTINGLSRIRIGTPFEEQTFVWSGSVFYRVNEPAPRAGEIIHMAYSTVPVGFAIPNGQSLTRSECPELFALWSTFYGTGAVPGTTFAAPNIIDRFIVAAGSVYAIGAVGGEATHTLLTAEMPVHNHNITQNPHDHAVTTSPLITSSGLIAGPTSPSANPQFVNIGADIDVSAANADITIDNTGSGAAHENRPPYFALCPVFRLC